MIPAEDPLILHPVERPRRQEQRFDPDFDLRLPAAPPPPRVLLPQQYQRLVANPFLALAGMVAWVGMIWNVDFRQRPEFVIVAALSGLLVTVLPQYHCLDCGRTGWLFRWRRHACAAVIARQRTGRVRRFRGPNPSTQFLIWLYVLPGVAILWAVAFRAVR